MHASHTTPPISPFHGQGPGAQARDGCSVELYRRLPYRNELAHLAPLLPAGTSVLELGCGTGRLTRPLLAQGCRVTAVDNSTDMLAYLPEGVEAVYGDIETLALGRTFDVVLLASGLINHASPTVRASFLAAAARHLGPGDQLILERLDPYRLRNAKVGHLGDMQGLAVAIEAVSHQADWVDMTLRYQEGLQSWTHHFSLQPLDNDQLQTELTTAGFTTLSWLDAAQRWACITQHSPRPTISEQHWKP